MLTSKKPNTEQKGEHDEQTTRKTKRHCRFCPAHSPCRRFGGPGMAYVTYLTHSEFFVSIGVVWRNLVLFGPKKNLFFDIKLPPEAQFLPRILSVNHRKSK
jgi:hypothetical protein